MRTTKDSDTITRITVNSGDDTREIILIGTAHVSKESAEEVSRVIIEEKPDNVCVEIDASRYKAMKSGSNWESLDIFKIIKEKKSFLMLANLALSSFQRKIGQSLDIKPGEEMKKAIETAEDAGIPYTFADREIQTTLRRAWAKTGFWGKNKLLSALLGSIFIKEKISSEEIENLKKRSELDSMMEELANYLPTVKEVLIDERDQYLASNIFFVQGKKIAAVVGAGHVPGIIKWIEKFEGGEKKDLSEISSVPRPSSISKVLPWIIPTIVAALIIVGFFISGTEKSLSMITSWVLINGSLSALGSLIALAHPLTIVLAFVAAPITSMNPTIGVGLFTGLCEAFLRKPRVKDLENLHDDILTFKGFIRNRVTHILIVFVLSSIGSSIGTFIALPYLTSLLS